jgi:hypothetical protein
MKIADFASGVRVDVVTLTVVAFVARAYTHLPTLQGDLIHHMQRQR